MINHTADPTCLYCEIKLLSAHPELAEIFHFIKSKFPDTHISWSFRNKYDQDLAVAAGKSNTPWPTSYHNKTSPDAKACSQAIDLFQITKEKPQGEWSVEKCREIYDSIKEVYPFLHWGGNFHHPDSDHFEIHLDELPLEPPSPVLETS